MAAVLAQKWQSILIGVCKKLVKLNGLKHIWEACKFTQPVSHAEKANCAEDTDISSSMDLDVIHRKLLRLISRLQSYNITLQIFTKDDIKYGSLIGKGGEAEVYKCTLNYKNIPVEAAAKIVLSVDEDALSITLTEIELLCLAYDPIVNTTIKVYGVAAMPSYHDPLAGELVILTEVGLMNALQLYQQENVPLHVTFEIWRNIASSFYILHTRHILHQDIKPENILITSINRNKQGQIEKIECRIIDLGMGKRLYSKKVITEDILGTNGYHPPEVLYEDSHDFRADVFMLGMTFCVLLHSPTFLCDQTKLNSLLKSIHVAKKKHTGRTLFENVIAPTLENLQNIPPCIIDMLCQMLERQDKRKITLLEVTQLCRSAVVQVNTEKSVKDVAVLLQKCCNNMQDSGFRSGGGLSKIAKCQKKVLVKKRSISPEKDKSPCQSTKQTAKKPQRKKLKTEDTAKKKGSLGEILQTVDIRKKYPVRLCRLMRETKAT